MDDRHIQWQVDGTYIRSDCRRYELFEAPGIIPGEPWRLNLLNWGSNYFLTFAHCQEAMYHAENDKRKREGREPITM